MDLKSILTLAATAGLLFTSCADSYEGAPKKGDGRQEAHQVMPLAVQKTNNYLHKM